MALLVKHICSIPTHSLDEDSGSKDNSGDKATTTPGPGDEPGEGVSTKYRLRGIVVHSGQASGGHYYSFIQVRYASVLPMCVQYTSHDRLKCHVIGWNVT